MKVILDNRVRKDALRVDRAWKFFMGSGSSLEGSRGLHGFTNWLWDELGMVAGNLNQDAKNEVEVVVPSLRPEALDFVLRIISFWANEVRLRKGVTLSKNLWRKPVVNVFDDDSREGAERVMTGKLHEVGSTEFNLMPIFGPSRGYFSIQVIEKGDKTARMHSHSVVDEYYLILEGRGTLRYNGKEIEVTTGDFIAKPTGPDSATHLIADKGERLRVLDMELWPDRFTGVASTTKDLMFWPDFHEVQMRGPGWGAVLPEGSLISTEDLERHFFETYKRSKSGKRVPSETHARRTG